MAKLNEDGQKYLVGKRLACIMRVSSDRQDTKEQQDKLEKWVEMYGIPILHKYELVKIPRQSRVFKKMIRKILEDAKGKYDVIVIPYLQRLDLGHNNLVWTNTHTHKLIK